MEDGFPSLTRFWPPDLPAWTFLGRAITVLGKAKYGDQWTNKEHSSLRLRAPYEFCSLPAVLDNCDQAQLKWIDRLFAHADEPLPPMPAEVRTEGQKLEFNHRCAWDLDTGFLDDREHEHDGREPSEDELHFYDETNKACIHAAHEQARLALRTLLMRLRPGVLAKGSGSV